MTNIGPADDPNWLAVRVQDVDNFIAARITTASAQIYKCSSNTFTAIGADTGGMLAGSVATFSVEGDTVTLEDDGTIIASTNAARRR